MRVIGSLLSLLACCGSVFSQGVPEAKAKAQALLDLTRSRQTAVLHLPPAGDFSPHIEPAAEPAYKAAFLAALEGKQVLIFVGGCSESVRRDFPGMSVIAMPAYRGVSDRRLVVHKDGTDYYWVEKDISTPGVCQLLGIRQAGARDVSPQCDDGSCEPFCENGICRPRGSTGSSARRGRGCASCGN